MKLSIICSANNETLLRDNLLRSPIVTRHELIVKQNYRNVAAAYNQAQRQAEGDYLIFVHQDVYLPESFEKDLLTTLTRLQAGYKYGIAVDWGVLGVAGKLGDRYLGHLLDRGNPWGSPQGLPAEVQTLDELLLILKRDTFQFDEGLPNHHLFGADICMQAREAGKWVLAIDAYCEHNSTLRGHPAGIELGMEYMRKKWQHRLPIHTTCVTIR
jgi:Glycosyltransferase like family